MYAHASGRITQSPSMGWAKKVVKRMKKRDVGVRFMLTGIGCARSWCGADSVERMLAGGSYEAHKKTSIARDARRCRHGKVLSSPKRQQARRSAQVG